MLVKLINQDWPVTTAVFVIGSSGFCDHAGNSFPYLQGAHVSEIIRAGLKHATKIQLLYKGAL